MDTHYFFKVNRILSSKKIRQTKHYGTSSIRSFVEDYKHLN